MLTLATRSTYTTLLDAETLRAADERPAIIYVSSDRPPVTVTRCAFAEATVTVAASLYELGLRPRDLIIIAHTQNLESIFAFWGALRLGAIPSMFPTLTEKLDAGVYMSSLAELARLSGVAAVLTTDAFAPVVRPRLPCPVYGAADLPAPTGIESGPASAGRTFHPPAPAEIAFLQHSSGTTGLQKGVALSHAAVLNQMAAYSTALALHENDVVVSWLPLYHDMGLIAGFLLPLLQGVPLVLMSPFDWVQHPALLFRAIHDYHGTLCWLPNFAYNHCARGIRRRDMDGLSAASMRLFVNCSEPVRHDSQTLFLERFAANGVRPEMLGVSYAMAENTFAVTQSALDAPPRLDIVDRRALMEQRHALPADGADGPTVTMVSCGRPIAHTELRIVDAERRDLPERHVGEVALRSNCMLSGYYHRPDATAQALDGGWYFTGDLGYLADGELYITGRQKDLIIVGGKNIYPQDIENALNDIPGVHPGRTVAFGVPNEALGTEDIAVICEVETDDPDAHAAITRAIRTRVAQTTDATARYVHLAGPRWLIKTSSGKIARAANRQQFIEQVLSQSSEGL